MAGSGHLSPDSILGEVHTSVGQLALVAAGRVGVSAKASELQERQNRAETEASVLSYDLLIENVDRCLAIAIAHVACDIALNEAAVVAPLTSFAIAMTARLCARKKLSSAVASSTYLKRFNAKNRNYLNTVPSAIARPACCGLLDRCSPNSEALWAQDFLRGIRPRGGVECPQSAVTIVALRRSLANECPQPVAGTARRPSQFPVHFLGWRLANWRTGLRLRGGGGMQRRSLASETYMTWRTKRRVRWGIR